MTSGNLNKTSVYIGEPFMDRGISSMAMTKLPTMKLMPKALVGEFRCVRGVVMKWYRITHPCDNLDPFWAEDRRGSQILLMPFDCEEKSDEVAASCGAHLNNSIKNGRRQSKGQGVFQVRTRLVI